MSMPRRSKLSLLVCLSVPSFAALSSGCADGGDDDYCSAQDNWRSEWAASEEAVLEIVNQRRAEGANCGGQDFAPAPPLTMNAELRCAARNHSTDMAVNEFFAHDNLAGESFVDRVNKTDYTGSPAGENIAAGYPDSAAVMSGWMDSPGHCSNIMNPSHTQIGIGLWAEGNLWTQVMGRE